MNKLMIAVPMLLVALTACGKPPLVASPSDSSATALSQVRYPKDNAPRIAKALRKALVALFDSRDLNGDDRLFGKEIPSTAEILEAVDSLDMPHGKDDPEYTQAPRKTPDGSLRLEGLLDGYENSTFRSYTFFGYLEARFHWNATHLVGQYGSGLTLTAEEYKLLAKDKGLRMTVSQLDYRDAQGKPGKDGKVDDYELEVALADALERKTN